MSVGRRLVETGSCLDLVWFSWWVGSLCRRLKCLRHEAALCEDFVLLNPSCISIYIIHTLTQAHTISLTHKHTCTRTRTRRHVGTRRHTHSIFINKRKLPDYKILCISDSLLISGSVVSRFAAGNGP